MNRQEKLEKLQRLQELQRQKAVREKVAKEKPEDTTSWATEEMPAWQKVAAGLASSVEDIGLNLGNMLGLVDDETITDTRAQNKQLGEDAWGKTGQIAGEIATLAVPGGAALKGARALSKVSKLVNKIGKVRGVAPAALGAGEGGLAGAVAANPNERVGGAAMGAGMGVAGAGLANAAGRMVKGIVKKTPEARQFAREARRTLGKDVDTHLPIAEVAVNDAGLSGAARFGYKQVLPNMPGSAGTIARQGEEAMDLLHNIAATRSAPESVRKVITQAKGNDRVQVIVEKLDEAFKKEFDDTIGSYAFTVADDDIMRHVVSKLDTGADYAAKEVGDNVRAILNKFAPDGVISGKNLTRAKREIARLGRDNSQAEEIGQAYYQANKGLDDLIEESLATSGKTDVFKRWTALREPYRNFLALNKASASEELLGRFTPAGLAKAGQTVAGGSRKGAGRGPMQKLAGKAGSVLTGEGKPSVIGRVATYATLGAGGFANPLIPVAAAGAGRILATRGAQKALLGETKLQRALGAKLRKKSTKKLLDVIGSATRYGAVSETVKD